MQKRVLLQFATVVVVLRQLLSKESKKIIFLK
jgi:hypothetical protein